MPYPSLALAFLLYLKQRRLRRATREKKEESGRMSMAEFSRDKVIIATVFQETMNSTRQISQHATTYTTALGKHRQMSISIVKLMLSTNMSLSKLFCLSSCSQLSNGDKNNTYLRVMVKTKYIIQYIIESNAFSKGPISCPTKISCSIYVPTTLQQMCMKV